MNRLSRWTETLRRLRPSQVGHRLVRLVRPLQAKGTFASAVWKGMAPLPPESRRPSAFPYDRSEGDDWIFAGHRARIGPSGLDWPDGGAPLLAKYHAGYAEWVRTLDETGDPAEAARRWIACASSLPTHPYVLSRRILSLLEFGARGAIALDQLLIQDAARLARAVEWDVRGNHLVANAAALYRIGCAHRGGASRDWKARGAAILSACAREQVLADGVHYERSPVYQGIVLEHFLTALETAAAAGEAPPRGVEDGARRMAVALSEMVLPDGELLRWRDGAPGMALPTEALLAWANHRAGPIRARRSGPREFSAAGLSILETEDGRSAATLLAAAPCPRDLPAHGHADALAYEAVLDGVRVVASSGTAAYAAGPARDRDRLPGAFAGCLLDGRAPADPWAAFRLGARGWVRRLETHVQDEASFALATSDGFFRGSSRVLHRRTVTLASGPHLAVVDEWIGRGDHDVALFLPLAPGLEIAIEEGGAVVSGPAGTYRLMAPGFALSVEDGVLATGLGSVVPRRVIRAAARVALPARRVHGWTVGGEPARVEATRVPAGEFRVVVARGARSTRVYVPAGAPP